MGSFIADNSSFGINKLGNPSCLFLALEGRKPIKTKEVASSPETAKAAVNAEDSGIFYIYTGFNGLLIKFSPDRKWWACLRQIPEQYFLPLTAYSANGFAIFITNHGS